MNPFDLRGPEFLSLYTVLLVIAVAAAALLRRTLRLPNDEPPREALDLSPYETAYLAGGEELAVNAAIARLVQAKVLAVNPAERKLTRCGDEPPPDAAELERAVFSAVIAKTGETIATVRAHAARALTPIRRRLQDLGLLVPEDRSGTARLVPVLIVLGVALVGGIKILVGLAREKPVFFLVMLCALTVVVALAGFAWPVHRSRRGDRALERLREANAALEYSGSRHADDLAGDDLVLALGLFGMGALAGGPLAELRTALKPPPKAGGGGGGCGSGCGGGGGGGGCGSGCGGGGCGGGCGGCGG